MTKESAIPLYGEVLNGFDKLLSSARAGGEEGGREDHGLLLARQSAFEKFKELGFPTTKNEDWKYTNITRFLKDEYDLDGMAPQGFARGNASYEKIVSQATIGSLDSYHIVLVNGKWEGQKTGDQWPRGIQLLTMAEARNDASFAGYFDKTREWEKYHFTALNAALSSNGLFIKADAGYVPDKPLHIIHVLTGDRNLLVQPRHIWVVNRNAELTVIESVVYAGGESKILANSLTEIMLEQDAKLNHYTIQMAGAPARLIQHTLVRQKRQSLYNNFTFTLPGSELVRNELHLLLEEERTESHLYGLYLAAGNQLVDNHTLVDHQKPSCLSNELYKGVLMGQSTGVFNGKIFVHKDAQKTNAFQQNNNLVLSNKATIDSKPQLEIYADDVKCSHGTTVGQFSEEALFYLRSRGIGEETARGLLVSAFAFDVTEKIKIPEVEVYINRLISDHISALVEVG